MLQIVRSLFFARKPTRGRRSNSVQGEQLEQRAMLSGSPGDVPVASDDLFVIDQGATLSLSVDPVTSLQMMSEEGDFIGRGLTYNHDLSNSEFGGHRNYDNGVFVRVSGITPDYYWDLHFAAPLEVDLATGYYPEAMRFPFQESDRPGLAVSGNGRGSNRLTGEFTVYEVEYDGDRNVVRFAADFEQHSEGKDPALFGRILFGSQLAAQGGVLANDVDAAGRLLAAELVSAPANGTLDFRADGTFDYTPHAGFLGTDTFTYVSSDRQHESNIATVSIVVRDPNRPEATVELDESGELRVHGSPGADWIRIRQSATEIRVFASFDGQAEQRFDFPKEEVHSLYVAVYEGDDDVNLVSGITYPATILGGQGDDLLAGGGGRDWIEGGAGNDTLLGDRGDDILIDLWGDNIVSGAGGDDTITTGNGADSINGGRGNDFIRAGGGNDVVAGGRGDDLLLGEAGDDELLGQNGSDVLIGGLGSDLLIGAQGKDLMLGGTTSFDSDPMALLAIFAQWSSKTPFPLRIDQLRQGGGLNGTNLLNAMTVYADGALDDLRGGDALDWAWIESVETALAEVIDIDGA